MTRLEEIKEWLPNTNFGEKHINGWVTADDVEYLIRRVERYEKYLKVISETSDGDNAGRAKKALVDEES